MGARSEFGSRPLDREYDPALTWAGALGVRLQHMTRAEIEAAWNSDVGRAHRAMLKKHLIDVLQQLVAAVQERLAELPKAA